MARCTGLGAEPRNRSRLPHGAASWSLSRRSGGVAMAGTTQIWSKEKMEQAAPPTKRPEGKRAFIKIRELNKRFGPRHILRGINIDVYKGETLVILGGSGS